MITIPLLIILLLYIALMRWLMRTFDSWPSRGVVALVFLSPFIYWIGSYQYMYYRHEQDCASEGGLKVFIQPEKVDSIQLDPDHFNESTAIWILHQQYPNIRAIEAWDGTYDGTGTGTRNGHFFSYTPDPATVSLSKKDWKFIKTPLTTLTDDIYAIDRKYQLIREISRTQTTLSRNGRVYASWTKFYHYWSRNGAMNIGWQCFEHEDPKLQLIKLISQ